MKAIAGEYNTYQTQVKAGKKISNNISIIAGGHYKQSDNANLASYYPDKFSLTDLTTFGGQTVVKAQDRVGYQGETQSYSAFSKLTFFKDLDIGFNYSFEQHRADVSSLPNYTDYGQSAYLNTDLGTAYANYKFTLNEDLGGFLRANYSWYELRPESRYVNIYDDFTQTGGYKYAFGSRKQLEGQLQYKLNDQHTVSGGFSLEGYYSLPKTADLSSPYNPNQSPANQTQFYQGTNNTLPIQIQQKSYTNIAGYLQWNANWHEMVSTSIAVRYDENSRYKGTFNPKLGLVFKPTDKITTKLLYSSAFLAPSMFYSGQHFGSFSGTQNAQGQYTSGYFMIPNPNLKPEKIDTFEFNADYKASKDLTFGLNLYYNSLKGMITWQATPMPVSNYISGGFINYTEYQNNVGNAITYGGDVHFNYQTSLDDSSLKLWGNYSYVDGTVSRIDQNYSTHLPMSPKHKVKVGLTYTYQDKYTITPKIYWNGRTNSSQSEANNPQVLQTISPYWRADLYVSAKVMVNFSLFVNVSNLFDRRYYNAAAFASSMIASPQDPRTLSAGFTYQFGD